jgi:uncharacterized protein (DUF111 family)
MDILFRESTTIGIRHRYSQRNILKRDKVTVDSQWGKIDAKKIIRPDGNSFIQPEYESCKKIAEEQGIPLREIYNLVLSENSRK